MVRRRGTPLGPPATPCCLHWPPSTCFPRSGDLRGRKGAPGSHCCEQEPTPEKSTPGCHMSIGVGRGGPGPGEHGSRRSPRCSGQDPGGPAGLVSLSEVLGLQGPCRCCKEIRCLGGHLCHLPPECSLLSHQDSVAPPVLSAPGVF